MLDISMKFKKGILVIKVKGNLTIDTSEYFKERFNKIVNKSGEKYCLLNIKDIDIIDKEGVGAIKSCYNKILKKNGKFILYGMDNIFNEEFAGESNLYQVNEEETAYRIVNL